VRDVSQAEVEDGAKDMDAFDETLMMQSMTDGQRMLFQSQLNAMRKDSTVGVLLAVFLGNFGAHHFYLGRTGVGVLYACFFWTFFPGVIALIEAFFMPRRVASYNNQRAFDIAAKVKMLGPASA
jgi:TM2 domain-containing membrane protein YozV